MTDQTIDLKQFVEGGNKVEIVLNDKKWTFREPTIRELLSITNGNDVDTIMNSLIIEGKMEELDEELNNLAPSQKQLFIANLLSKLGLVGKTVVDEIKSTTKK